MLNDTIPFWHHIDGWFDYQDLYDEILDGLSPGDLFVEVGSYLGKSACYLGNRIRDLELNIRIVCVDIWPSLYIWPDGTGRVTESPYETFIANVRQSGLTETIIPLRCPSVVAAQLLRDNIGAVFIDGDHSLPAVREDIMVWRPKIANGGFLAGHDFNPSVYPGVCHAVMELCPCFQRASAQCWMERL